jgi:beta-galactosidase
MPRRIAKIIGAAAAAMLLSQVAVAAAATPGLMGSWSLDEHRGQIAHDLSGNRLHGYLGATNAADSRDPRWVASPWGWGLRFDGKDDVLRIADSPKLRLQKVTVEISFRANKSPGRWRYLIAKGGNRCEAGSYGLYSSSNGGLAFYVYDGHQWKRSPEAAKPAVWNGRWHRVYGSFDGRFARLWVDGRQIGNGTEFAHPISYTLPTKDATFGIYRGTCDLSIKADIDNVRIWSLASPPASLEALLGH